jgi:hypothetical protein
VKTWLEDLQYSQSLCCSRAYLYIYYLDFCFAGGPFLAKYGEVQRIKLDQGLAAQTLMMAMTGKWFVMSQRPVTVVMQTMMIYLQTFVECRTADAYVMG